MVLMTQGRFGSACSGEGRGHLLLPCFYFPHALAAERHHRHRHHQATPRNRESWLPAGGSLACRETQAPGVVPCTVSMCRWSGSKAAKEAIPISMRLKSEVPETAWERGFRCWRCSWLQPWLPQNILSRFHDTLRIIVPVPVACFFENAIQLTAKVPL